MTFKEVLEEGKGKYSLSISRNGRFTCNVNDKLYIASKSVSEQVIATGAEEEDDIVLALAAYDTFENEEGLTFISNAAAERKTGTLDLKALKKVKAVEGEEFSERLTKMSRKFSLETAKVVL